MSYEIMIKGAGPNGMGRSYIVGKEDVIKGGKLRSYTAGAGIREEVELSAGNTIYHVTDKCGKLLSSYSDVFVLRIDGKEVEPKVSKEKMSVDEQIARLTAQIEDLKSKPKKAKAKKKKEAIAP